MNKEEIRKVIKLIKEYHSGIFPDEDTDNLYYPEHAIESALKDYKFCKANNE